ncbi:MAG: hypothetical protein NXI00_12275 [Cytophagales bacterium]|nr:hypothetical protein [Cytophagales bacterium]
MIEVQNAYKYLRDKGISQKYIINHLNKSNITPARSESYTPVKLSRMINEGYAWNQAAADAIIKLSKSELV